MKTLDQTLWLCQWNSSYIISMRQNIWAVPKLCIEENNEGHMTQNPRKISYLIFGWNKSDVSLMFLSQDLLWSLRCLTNSTDEGKKITCYAIIDHLIRQLISNFTILKLIFLFCCTTEELGYIVYQPEM